LRSKHKLHLHPHLADAAVGEIAIEKALTFAEYSQHASAARLRIGDD
jgi:hypothetical protein